MEKIKLRSIGSLRVKTKAELLSTHEQQHNESSNENKCDTDTDDYDEDYDDDNNGTTFDNSDSVMFNKKDIKSDKNALNTEKIEVVPEFIPYDYDYDTNDGADVFNENMDDRSVEDDIAALYNGKVGDEEEFDEYGYQVGWNYSEQDRILAGGDQFKGTNASTSRSEDDDVILIESDDGDDDDDESKDDGSFSGMNNFNNNSGGDPNDRKVYECDVCFRKVASSYNLKRHMMIHTGEKPFGCDICDRRFREFSDLKKHRRVHSAEKHFKCMVCHRNPPSATNSTKCAACEKKEAAQRDEQHASEQIIHRDENNKKAYVCNHCDRIFGSSSNLKRHIMIHTGEKPFKCEICLRSFRELSTLKKHLVTHRNSKPICFVCAKTCSSLSELELHLHAHKLSNGKLNLKEITITAKPSGNKVYRHKCPICNDIFFDSFKLMTHMCTVHNQSRSSYAQMSKSPPPLIRIKPLTAEIPSQLNGLSPWYPCKICSKKFRKLQHFESHMLTHRRP